MEMGHHFPTPISGGLRPLDPLLFSVNPHSDYCYYYIIKWTFI